MSLYQQWMKLQQDEPRLRIRDAANRLGVTEAEILAAGCPEPNTRLKMDAAGLLDGLRTLGELMVLIRNDAAVHEKDGPMTEAEIDGMVGVVHGGPLDLRLFFRVWTYAFAVRSPAQGSIRRSIQFFDERGDAILKAFLPLEAAQEKVLAFEELVRGFADHASAPVIVEKGSDAADRPDVDIDVEALRADWAALQDTHDFFGMLRKHRVGRLQALRLVGAPFATEVPKDIAQPLLEFASTTQLPIMVFVGNRGAINIHSGTVNRVKANHGWLNVLDPAFSLHLDTTKVRSAWQVEKPTVDGVVTSIELFDEKGESIALFFGERKPGIPELPAWREALQTIREAMHG